MVGHYDIQLNKRWANLRKIYLFRDLCLSRFEISAEAELLEGMNPW